MYKPNYSDIAFDHAVEFPEDDIIFGAGREQSSGRSRLFLIFNHTGRIYSRNGRADSWEVLGEEDARSVRQTLARSNIPYYTTSGKFELLAQ